MLTFASTKILWRPTFWESLIKFYCTEAGLQLFVALLWQSGAFSFSVLDAMRNFARISDTFLQLTARRFYHSNISNFNFTQKWWVMASCLWFSHNWNPQTIVHYLTGVWGDIFFLNFGGYRFLSMIHQLGKVFRWRGHIFFNE